MQWLCVFFTLNPGWHFETQSMWGMDFSSRPVLCYFVYCLKWEPRKFSCWNTSVIFLPFPKTFLYRTKKNSDENDIFFDCLWNINQLIWVWIQVMFGVVHNLNSSHNSLFITRDLRQSVPEKLPFNLSISFSFTSNENVLKYESTAKVHMSPDRVISHEINSALSWL